MSQPYFAQLIDDRQKIINPQSLVNHHLLVVGQTGSGKTTSILSLLSCLQQSNYTTIVLDPTGEYKKLPNAVTYRLADNAYLEAGQFSAPTLCEALGLQADNMVKKRLASAIDALRIQKNLYDKTSTYSKIGVKINHYQAELAQLGSWAESFDVTLLADQLREEFIVPNMGEKADYSVLGQQYDQQSIMREWYTIVELQEKLVSQEFRALFDPQPADDTTKAELNFVIKMFLAHKTTHRTLVIDLSALKRFGLGQKTVISALLKHLLATRLSSQIRFPVNIVLDEAHRYLPDNDDQLASNGIFQVLREGRKVGLSMTMTTQSPLDLPARLRSQFANLLIHHLTSPEELHGIAVADSVNLKRVSQLQTGEAVMLLADEHPQQIKVNLPQWWDQ